MSPRTRYLIRVSAVPVYVIVVLIGVWVGRVVWFAVIGALLLSLVYTYARGGTGPWGRRPRNRDRNRNRNRGGAPDDDAA